MLLCLRGGCPVLPPSSLPPRPPCFLLTFCTPEFCMGLILREISAVPWRAYYYFLFLFFFLENQCFLSLESEILQSLIHLLPCVRSPSKVPRFSFLDLMRVTRGFRDLALSCHGFAHFSVLWFTTALPRRLSLKERRGQTDSRLGKKLFQKRTR